MRCIGKEDIMKPEQFERAKEIQCLIETEKRNMEHMEQFKKCKELIILNNSEDVKKEIKGMYYGKKRSEP